jgi:hypothetical protein
MKLRNQSAIDNIFIELLNKKVAKNLCSHSRQQNLKHSQQNRQKLQKFPTEWIKVTHIQPKTVGPHYMHIHEVLLTMIIIHALTIFFNSF